MRKICITLAIILGLSSCKSYYLSPSVRFQNSSRDGSEIRNIQVIWNGYNLLKVSGPKDSCFGMDEQSFAVRREPDIFGPVHAEWENAKGDKISKDFIFKKDDLTSRPYHLSTIYLFFTQTDVEYYTSDNPNIKKIEREKSGNWISKWYEKEGKTKCVNDPKEVQRLREINKKYPVTSTVTGKPINDD